jgi:hypothetical protein
VVTRALRVDNHGTPKYRRMGKVREFTEKQIGPWFSGGRVECVELWEGWKAVLCVSE